MAEGFDARHVRQTAIEALQRGDNAAARDRFRALIAAGQADVAVWLGLSMAANALGDSETKLQALDQALALEPRNVRALLMKGFHLQRAGEEKTALAYLTAALRAAPPPEQLTPDLLRDLHAARDLRDAAAEKKSAFLRGKLSAAGFGESRATRRFFESLDLLEGRKRLYLQEPLFYYFPGLPQIQFYEREQFAWIEAVEARTADIREELLGVLAEEGAFTPYVDKAQAGPSQDYRGMLGNPHWGAYFLWKDGARIEDHAVRCPKTMAALESAPLTEAAGRMPSVLFSKLDPHTRIPPHNGFINARLIVHLPLIVPPGCGFRVGAETREWVEGKALIFDDSIEHEAWNDSDQLRVVLLFEIWRPELSAEERAMVATLFAAIDEFAGPDRVEWRD